MGGGAEMRLHVNKRRGYFNELNMLIRLSGRKTTEISLFLMAKHGAHFPSSGNVEGKFVPLQLIIWSDIVEYTDRTFQITRTVDKIRCSHSKVKK